MIKIITILSISALLFANDVSLENFLKSALISNSNLSNIKVISENKKNIDGLKGWRAEVVLIQADLMQKGKKKHISENATYFTNGRFLTSDLTDMKNGMKITLSPKFNKQDYKKSNLIIGSAKSVHKIVIFSDPLCPFCQKEVPKALRILCKHPNKFAVYYYSLPLEGLHPASKTLVKIATVLEDKAISKSDRLDALLSVYDIEINPHETDEVEILNQYNKQFATSILKKEIDSKKVLKSYSNDISIAQNNLVNGTPTFYFDGNLDKTKKEYLDYIK